jgi:hypothetical protein
MVENWIDMCRNEHESCVWPDSRPLPTRVIDVGLTDDATPYVLISNGKIGHWATLSYFWGSQLPFKTTLDSLEERQNGFSRDQLSPLFGDVIKLVRRLKIRYLWIDALCIVQDSPEDWSRESSKMHQIYAEARINITAACSTGSSDGLFVSADRSRENLAPLLSLPCYDKRKCLSGWISLELYDLSFSLVEDLAHTRAWVWQETELSSRRIDYATQMRWSCNTKSVNEMASTNKAIDLISGSAREFYGTVSNYYVPRPNLEAEQGLQNSTSQPMEYWYDGVNRFRGRDITYQEDRLPAIAGVAKRVQTRTRYHYKAGLWLEDIHRGLLWNSGTSGQRSLTTRASSWSWASMTGDLTYELFDPPLWAYAEGYRATIDDIKVKCNADDPFSFVTSASLTLTSLCQGFPRSEFSPSLEKDFRYEQFNIKLDDPSVALQNDLLCVHIAVFCLLCPWPDEDAAIYALLLEETGVENEYKRVGLARVPKVVNSVRDWTTRTVTIV